MDERKKEVEDVGGHKNESMRGSQREREEELDAGARMGMDW